MLTRYSEFFAAALCHDWKESKDAVVRLEEEDPGLLQVFASFLYRRRIYTRPKSSQANKAPHGTTRGTKVDALVEVGKSPNDTIDDPEWDQLIECWMLGDRLMSQAFQDASIDAMVEKISETGNIPMHLHLRAYATNTRSDALKRLAVDIAAFQHKPADIRETAEESPGAWQFLHDLAVRQSDRLQSRASPDWRNGPWETEPCRYHEHVRGECYRLEFWGGDG